MGKKKKRKHKKDDVKLIPRSINEEIDYEIFKRYDKKNADVELGVRNVNGVRPGFFGEVII